MQTHEVFNQSPPFENINLFGGHPFLKKLISLAGANWCQEDLEKYGNLMGSRGWIEKGHLANKYPPVFRSHDRFGKRIDQVDFHPAYHEIMQTGMENKLHSLPWLNPKKGSHAARLALNYLHAQNEAGSNCPITMTFSCVPALSKHFAMANSWLPKITAPYYDARNIPFYDKKALTIGMAMTEKQGGTDVRANTSQAKALGKKGNGELYAITGHKWFCSAPMSDAFLTLAGQNTVDDLFRSHKEKEMIQDLRNGFAKDTI
ncbi:MAG: acyl-CoA dehydrogenase family protein, partial [Luteibaculum sp.]